MNCAEYLLPPLPGCGDLKGTTAHRSTQDSDKLAPHERHRKCDGYSESQYVTRRSTLGAPLKKSIAVYKGYDAYHAQMRKLNWLKAHDTSAISPEVSKHAKWLIETLQAIIARWEEVLPYVARPYPKPPDSPSAFS
jgi:hypothetical protein